MTDISAEPIRYVEDISVKIGHRPAGSPENRAAAEYIEGLFRSSELAVERQLFNCTSWENQETLLTVDGVQYEGEANWWSLPCEVTGTIVPICAIEELEQTDLTGCIALLYGELTQDELSPRHSTAYYPEHHKKINQLLDQKKPLGVITVSPLLQALRHVIKDPGMDIPSATVIPEVGLKLLRNTGKSLRVKIVSCRSQGQAWNILGTRAGNRPEQIVISAHYDTV